MSTDQPIFSPNSKINVRIPPLDATRHKQLIGALPSERAITQAPRTVNRAPPSTRSSFLGIPSSATKPLYNSSSNNNNNSSSLSQRSSTNNNVSSTDSIHTTELPPITSFRSEDGSRLYSTCGKTFVSRLNADAWRRYCIVTYQEQITRTKTTSKIQQSLHQYHQQLQQQQQQILDDDSGYGNHTNVPPSNASSVNPSRETSPEPIKRTISFSTQASPVSGTTQSTTTIKNNNNKNNDNTTNTASSVSLNTSLSSAVELFPEPSTPGRERKSGESNTARSPPQPPKSPYQIFMSPRSLKRRDYNDNTNNITTNNINTSFQPSVSSASSVSLTSSPIPSPVKKVSIKIEGERAEEADPSLHPPNHTTTTRTIFGTTVPSTDSRSITSERTDSTDATVAVSQLSLDQRFANVENQLKSILIENKLLREKIDNTEALLIQSNLQNNKYQTENERLQKELATARQVMESSNSSSSSATSGTGKGNNNTTNEREDEQIRNLQQDIDKLRKLIMEKDTILNHAYEKEHSLRTEIASLTMRAAAASGMALIRVGNNTGTGSPLASPQPPSASTISVENSNNTNEETVSSAKPEIPVEVSKETVPSIPNPLNQEKSPLAKRRWQALSTLQQTGTLLTLANDEESTTAITTPKKEGTETSVVSNTEGDNKTDASSTPRTPTGGLFALAAAASSNSRNSANGNNRTPVLGLLATAALRSQQQQQSSTNPNNRSSPLLSSSLLTSSRRPSGLLLPPNSPRSVGDNSVLVLPSLPLTNRGLSSPLATVTSNDDNLSSPTTVSAPNNEE